MGSFGRWVIAILAVFVLWTLIRAFRSGTIYSEGYAINLDDKPMAFSLAAAVHVGILAFFAWLAAGHDAASFWHLVAPR